MCVSIHLMLGALNTRVILEVTLIKVEPGWMTQIVKSQAIVGIGLCKINRTLVLGGFSFDWKRKLRTVHDSGRE